MLRAFKNFNTREMLTTRKANHFLTQTFFLLLLLLVNTVLADNSKNHTPAGLLAKQTGATLFEEERFETHTDCSDPSHQVKKRSSDEDVDYEVYQGVVGRPGIDFPIYPRIPKTSFSCRSFGNGYFADMETECQVFHICEDGRKISFLCPNGTIFQQSELTCDWWFKVNCMGSQGYYAESAEILNKQRVQRIRPVVPVQGFNIVGGATSSGLDIKPKLPNGPSRPSQLDDGTDRRVDSSEFPSMESIDFEDISGEKQVKEQQAKKVISHIDNNNSDNESQITAETASFVGSKRRGNYVNDKSAAEKKETRTTNGSRNGGGSRRGQSERASQRHRHSATSQQSNRSEANERSRSSQRGKQRFREERKPSAESYESDESREPRKKPVVPEKIVQPIQPSDISTKIDNQVDTSADAEVQPEYYEIPSTRSAQKSQSTTAIYSLGTYSTARRLDSTRTTPFYTPTVPPVVKSKTTEGKSFYVKGGPVASTPNPRSINAGSSLAQESTGKLPSKTATKSSSSLASSELEAFSPTLRPIVIGMRQVTQEATPGVYRIAVAANSHFSTEDLALQRANSSDPLQPTTVPPVTGPTYLPKGASSERSPNVNAGGDSLLFAPSPINDASVRRNVDEMLKTMNLLKSSMDSSKIRDVEEFKFQGQVRTGLEIPPSSGPDALVTLAKYFASEQNEATADSLNTVATRDTEKARKSVAASAAANAASISTTALRSAENNSDTAYPTVSVKADGIKSSLLSEKTVNQYSDLFGLGIPTSTDPSEGLLSNVSPSERERQKARNTVTNNPFPQIGNTDAAIRSLANKPESRKIAQVFSNALSTYLENPKTFREQLASARPTEPPATDRSNSPITSGATQPTTFKSTTSVPFLPTKTTPVRSISMNSTGSIAAEINNKFDLSTPGNDFSSTTELYDSSTNRASTDSSEKQLKLELSAELLPPSAESGEGDEFLQREQTQSFVKSRNELELIKSGDQKRKHKITSNAAYVADLKPTENPWNHISQSDFLDPLTINDGLMKGQGTTTISPFTYLPKDATTANPLGTRSANDNQQAPSKYTQRSLSNHLQGTATAHDRHPLDPESWRDIFNSYDLPLETLPSSSGLQRIANKLFGGLNETEALHLKNVMQQAEHNRQVLSLLLLLIQTCDDQNGKALERSRKHLLNALIDMDGKLQNGKTAHHHRAGSVNVIGTTNPTITTTTSTSSTSSSTTTASPIPVTTYRRSSEDYVTSTPPAYPSTTTTTTTTDLPSTTLSSSTVPQASIEETTKFEIRVEDVEEDLVAAPSAAAGAHNNSDQRALELLKSLYSLASKFTSRR